MESTWFEVGEARVLRIPDLELNTLKMAALLPGLEDGRREGTAVIGVHAWLVLDRGRMILVDTGAGDGKNRPHAPYFTTCTRPFWRNWPGRGRLPRISTWCS